MGKNAEIDYPRHRAAALDALHARLAAKAAMVDFLRSANVFRPSTLLEEVREELEQSYDDVIAAAGIEGAAVKTPKRIVAASSPPPAPRALPPAKTKNRGGRPRRKEDEPRLVVAGSRSEKILEVLDALGGASLTPRLVDRIVGAQTKGRERALYTIQIAHMVRVGVLERFGEKHGRLGTPIRRVGSKAMLSESSSGNAAEDPPNDDDKHGDDDEDAVDEAVLEDAESSIEETVSEEDDDRDEPFCDLDRIPAPRTTLALANDDARDFAVVDVKTKQEVERYAELGAATKALRPGHRVRRVSTGSWMTQPLGVERPSEGDASMRKMAIGDEALDVEGLDEIGG